MFCNKSEKHFLDESTVTEFEKPVNYKKIEEYILKLSEAAPIWYDLHNSKNITLKKILVLNRSKELRVFILSVFLTTKNESKRNEILINLEKILFRNRIPGIGILDERTPASWGRDLYNKEDDLEGIVLKQQNLISTPIPINNLIQSFTNLYTYERGTKGYHRWNALKYFLFEFDEHLKIKARETTDKVLWSDFEDTTIEHIIPQKYSDHWLSEVDEILNKVADNKKEIASKVLLNTLGNLTILKNGKNSSLGNYGWKIKKLRFSTGSYNEIDVSKKTKWNKNSISKRGYEMLEFLESRVDGLSLKPNEKKRLLFHEPEIMKLFR